MKRKRFDHRARYVVLRWQKRHGEEKWFLAGVTLTHSLGMAKRLRTINARYWNIKTSIVPEELLEGVGEISEPTPRKTRKQLLVEHFDKLEVKTARQ